MGRTKQGGSVLSFIIVGVVLASVLAGGVYVVQQQVSQSQQPTPPSEPAPAPEKQPEEQKQEAVKPQENRSDTKTGTQEEKKQQTPAPQPDTQKEAALPETGPAELFTSVLALGLLSAGVVAYVRSRRPGLHFDF